MTGKEFLKLQVAMFVTDVENTRLKSDYCLIQEFKGKDIILLPLDEYGQPNGKLYRVDFRYYDLQDSMYKSDFIRNTV